MSMLVGLDVGSQSVKLVAYDFATHHIVATHSHALDMTVRDDGSCEQLPEWWLHAIRACFAKLTSTQRAQVIAIGVSGQQHGFVPLDAAGRVLAPAKLWCDTSTQRECDDIMRAAGGATRC